MVALVLAVVLAATAGYLLGSHRITAPHHTTARAAPSSSTNPAPPGAAEPIAQTGNRCSAPRGDQLQLGVEIRNRSATTVTLEQVQPVLPLHGLRPTASAWGACGQLSPVPAGHGFTLSGGATVWVTMTFDVLVACPGPLPVLFTLTYTTQSGQPGVTDLPGFPDLGDVPYTSTRCTAGSS
jgi:hypothetical protein